MNENLDLFEKVINKTIPKVDYVDIRGVFRGAKPCYNNKIVNSIISCPLEDKQ